MTGLLAPVDGLRGVGPKTAPLLHRLGLKRCWDLLLHLPFRYQDRTRITPIADLRPEDYAVVQGEVRLAAPLHRASRSQRLWLMDGSGQLSLRFFHLSPGQQGLLTSGRPVRCFGQVRRAQTGLELVHPEFQCLSELALQPIEEHLTPIYPSTQGLSQSLLRRLIGQALPLLDAEPESLPASLLAACQDYSLAQALALLHQPPPETDASLLLDSHPARQRLILEELLAYQLGLRRKQQPETRLCAPILRRDAPLQQRFLSSLPFQPTLAQQRVATEIQADLQRPQPMRRLVQGDVGSGKTLVAALAALPALAGQQQVALMAPTELLARQHAETFDRWWQPLGFTTALLLGSQTKKQRQQAQAQLASGQALMAIGTHALFQAEVEFARLGLVMIDEQHRFGVAQRLALWDKGREQSPHQLILTATPIPRTLAMSLYGDLEVSVIDELPPNRTPVSTLLLSAERRPQLIERIRDACQHGRQAYWVCTLIAESELIESQAAEQTWQTLQQALPELRIGLVHGQMKPADKQARMQAFKQAELDLLVATTVIEVGVDVPNASLMIIENAERLGLAQLHQLRGRVGRGAVESHCILLYQAPLSRVAEARLRLMRDTQDGFRIAEQDLKLRGAGEVLGVRQSGDLGFKVASLYRDADWLAQVRDLSRGLDWQRPELSRLLARWQPQSEQLSQV